MNIFNVLGENNFYCLINSVFVKCDPPETIVAPCSHRAEQFTHPIYIAIQSSITKLTDGISIELHRAGKNPVDGNNDTL